jgi:predicted CoA-binding protein
MSLDSVATARGEWTPPTAGRRRAILQRARTIAVVGASANPARASNFVLTYLLSSSADYEVWPVTPNEDEVLGVQAVRIAHEAGLEVITNRCLKIEHARFHGGLHLAGFDTGVISSRRTRG